MQSGCTLCPQSLTPPITLSAHALYLPQTISGLRPRLADSPYLGPSTRLQGARAAWGRPGGPAEGRAGMHGRGLNQASPRPTLIVSSQLPVMLHLSAPTSPHSPSQPGIQTLTLPYHSLHPPPPQTLPFLHDLLRDLFVIASPLICFSLSKWEKVPSLIK